MKSLIFLILTLSFLPSNATADPLTVSEYAAVENYIKDCARDWAESGVTGDRTRRKIYIAEDFLGTEDTGERYGKDVVVKETGPSKELISNTVNNVKVTFFGNTAIAYGDQTWVRKDGSTGLRVWTDVWVRRNGNWQIVAAQDVDVPTAN